MTRTPALDEQLTSREREVLDLLAEGLSNVEIGQRLFLSRDTVKSHARTLFKKLGASGRADAVVRGRESGLLPPVAVPSVVEVPRATLGLLVAVAELVVAGRQLVQVRPAAVEALVAVDRRLPGLRPLVPGVRSGGGS